MAGRWRGDGPVACGLASARHMVGPGPRSRLWTCGTYGPAWSFGVHMRVGCMRWEGTSFDPCIVTRGSGATFLFTPEAAGAVSAGASLVGSTSAGVAASAPASTAGCTSTAACVGWGWQKSTGFGRVMQQVVAVRGEPFHPTVALGFQHGQGAVDVVGC